MSSLPVNARPHMELQLDFGHGGVEKDLYELSFYMLDWEEKVFANYLGLTAMDISDIKDIYPIKPALQR